MAIKIVEDRIAELLDKFSKFSKRVHLTRSEATRLSAYVLANSLWHHPQLEEAKKQAFELVEELIKLKLEEVPDNG